MKKEYKEIIKNKGLKTATLVAIISCVIFFTKFLNTKDKAQEQQTITTQTTQQSQYPDYDNFNASKQLEISKNYETKGSVSGDGSLKKYFKLNEKNSIESAYIYIEASVNGKPLGFYDDLYLKINNTGGHLIKDSNFLQVPQKENISTYLLPLASISYKPNRDSKSHKFEANHDFLNTINETKKFDIVAHINSKKKDKVLIKVIVGYSCLDNINCNLHS